MLAHSDTLGQPRSAAQAVVFPWPVLSQFTLPEVLQVAAGPCLHFSPVPVLVTAQAQSRVGG